MLGVVVKMLVGMPIAILECLDASPHSVSDSSSYFCGRQQMMAQVIGSPSLNMEAWIELQALGFDMV